MVQAEGQQQTVQRAIDERSQNGRSLGRVCDPDAEVVDAGLDHRPEQCQHHGNDHRIGNDHHRHKALAVEEGQCIRQLAEVIVFIVSHAAHKTGNNAHEHAHVQGRGTQHRGEVAVDGDLPPEQGVGHGVGVFQHGAGDTEDVAGDDIDEGKCQHSRKSTAGTLLCPAAADGHGKQDVQIVDDRPANVSMVVPMVITAAMSPPPICTSLPRLIIRPAAGMTAMTVISTLPSFCKKSKLISPFFPGAACVVAIMFLLVSFCAILRNRCASVA